MKKILDISQPLYPGMPVYPGDPHFASERVCGFDSGDDCEVSALSMGSHCGTHIDAPRHMIAGGEGMGAFPLERFLGPCRVLTLDVDKSDPLIREDDLRGFDIKAGERILLRTNPRGQNREKTAALGLCAARLLAKKRIDLIGIDSPSVEDMAANGGEVHRTLLRAGIAILEGLRLERADKTHYALIALPLRMEGENGSPCRAVLIDEENE